MYDSTNFRPASSEDFNLETNPPATNPNPHRLVNLRDMLSMGFFGRFRFRMNPRNLFSWSNQRFLFGRQPGIAMLALICVIWSGAHSFALADQTVNLNGDAGGKRFDGIGAVSGGGATSVLLKDYPEPQRSQVLDLLFKPKFGASMSALLVEVPGDGNSTQGAEPSHMHSRDDLNFSRGYEWWLMREAKKRNPDLSLDACAWGCPGWVGNGNFWSQDMCDYYAKWILGLKSVYGLNLDAIGCRNERGVVEDFAIKFRATLDANGLENVKIHGFDNWDKTKFDWTWHMTNDVKLRHAVAIFSNHTMADLPTPAGVRKLADDLGKPIWNTEEHVYKKGFDCEISLVKAFNENFLVSGVTKIVNWYLVGSVYPLEPYSEDPAAMIANSPWSGYYRVREVLWGYAHYGQFSKIGWQYLNGACGHLDGGGSFVTLKSPGQDYSVILETKDATTIQNVTFKVAGGLSTGKLCVWRSDASEQFVRQADLTLVNGSFTLVLEPNAIYSVTTTTGQQKGAFANIPAEQKFPFPYRETFDEYTSPEQFGWLPHYTADIAGVFEIAGRPGGTGKCLRQVTGEKPQSWAPEWMPYTILGDADWQDYEVSADVYLDHGGWAGVMGRVNNVGDGYGCTPKGYYLRLDADGQYALVAISGKAGAAELGDKEHQARLRAEGNPAGKGEDQVADGVAGQFDAKQWHNLKLRFVGSTITGFVDGAPVLSVTNQFFARGMVGLVTGDSETRNTACFDNLTVNSPGADTPSPTPLANIPPIYP
jgi:galactosylceramidase